MNSDDIPGNSYGGGAGHALLTYLYPEYKIITHIQNFIPYFSRYLKGLKFEGRMRL